MIDPGSTEDLSRRAIAVVFAAGLLVGVVGIGAAVTVTGLEPDVVSLFDSQASDSEFTVRRYEPTVTGRDSLEVEMVTENTDGVAHSANVTVQVLDAEGDVIAAETKPTGSVAGGAVLRGTYRFRGERLGMRYDGTFVVVEQTG